MPDLFELSSEAAAQLDTYRVCKYVLLKNRVEAAAASGNRNRENSRSTPGWLESMELNVLARQGSPFFWLNVDRCHDACSLDSSQLPAALRNLQMTAFDAYFELLPDGACCQLAPGDPVIVLPRLGVRFTSSGSDVLLRRVRQGILDVEDGQRPRTRLVLADLPPEARLPWLPVGNAHTRLLLCDDTALFAEAYASFILADPPDPTPRVGMIASALQWIRTVDSQLGDQISTQIQWYVPLVPRERGKYRAGTVKRLPGVMFLSETENIHLLAEVIVHEYYHGVLHARMELDDLLIGDADRRFYSPWRDDPRPLEMLLHALYVFAGVAQFLRRSEATPELAHCRDALRERRRTITEQLALGHAQAPAELFTPSGAGLLQGIKDVIDDHEADLGLSGGPLPKELDAHLKKWCAAHPHMAAQVRRPMGAVR
jgi:HEXXH motif-containing protein